MHTQSARNLAKRGSELPQTTYPHRQIPLTMSLVLIPSNQHHSYMSDDNSPMIPGQPGYPVYHPNQGQPEETPAPGSYGSFTHTSPTSPLFPQYAGYQYMGNFPPPMSQSTNSQAFVLGANVNLNAAPTANTFFGAQGGSAFTPSNQSANSISTPTISPSQTQFDPADASQFYEGDNDDDAKGRHDSLYPKDEETSPTTTTETPSKKRASIRVRRTRLSASYISRKEPQSRQQMSKQAENGAGSAS